MEPIQNQSVSILEIQEKERCTYEWDFKIPTKGRIVENIRSVPNGKYHFKNLKFKTGALCEIEHSWEMFFNTDKFDVILSYPKSEYLSIFIVAIQISLISKTFIRSKHDFTIPELENLSSSDSIASNLQWTASWSHQAAIEKRNIEAQQTQVTGGILSLAKKRSNSIDMSEQSDFWTDAIDTIRVTFTIEIERPGRCISDALYQPNGKAAEVIINKSQDEIQMKSV